MLLFQHLARCAESWIAHVIAVVQGRLLTYWVITCMISLATFRVVQVNFWFFNLCYIPLFWIGFIQYFGSHLWIVAKKIVMVYSWHWCSCGYTCTVIQILLSHFPAVCAWYCPDWSRKQSMVTWIPGSTIMINLRCEYFINGAIKKKSLLYEEGINESILYCLQQ